MVVLVVLLMLVLVLVLMLLLLLLRRRRVLLLIQFASDGWILSCGERVKQPTPSPPHPPFDVKLTAIVLKINVLIARSGRAWSLACGVHLLFRRGQLLQHPWLRVRNPLRILPLL
jgi:hypothetical protein